MLFYVSESRNFQTPAWHARTNEVWARMILVDLNTCSTRGAWHLWRWAMRRAMKSTLSATLYACRHCVVSGHQIDQTHLPVIVGLSDETILMIEAERHGLQICQVMEQYYRFLKQRAADAAAKPQPMPNLFDNDEWVAPQMKQVEMRLECEAHPNAEYVRSNAAALLAFQATTSN